MWMLAAAFLTAAFFLISRRRHLPEMGIDLDGLPPVEEGLATLAGLTRAAVHCSNGATIFQNGALFPAMEADVEQARETVHLETFVWHAGTVERRWVDLLSRKAREGVKVRVLLDYMGAMRADEQQLQRLRDAGVELLHYCKPHPWNLRRMNHRSHRKLLIVDGRVGYTFGHGIGDEWLGDAQDHDHWRDTGVRLEGAVVHALQSVFFENWIEESRCIPSGHGCFPKLEECGQIEAHVVSSECGDAVSSVALLYTVAIGCARREVLIQNPYFAPGHAVLDLLASVVKRGVAVHLMVPGGHTDSPFVRRAGHCVYEGLLRAGVRIYEFEPTLLHQKIVIVDGVWSHIGSTNFDPRSLAINEEVGIGLLDREIAGQLREAFWADRRRCREIVLDEWLRRPRRDRVLNWLAYRLHNQL